MKLQWKPDPLSPPSEVPPGMRDKYVAIATRLRRAGVLDGELREKAIEELVKPRAAMEPRLF